MYEVFVLRVNEQPGVRYVCHSDVFPSLLATNRLVLGLALRPLLFFFQEKRDTFSRAFCLCGSVLNMVGVGLDGVMFVGNLSVYLKVIVFPAPGELHYLVS